MSVVGSDIPTGTQVKWYAGGVVKTESITVLEADVTAGFVALSKKAEYGSVIATVGGVLKAVSEFIDGDDTAATETTGTGGIFYTGMAKDDVIEVQYLDIETTPLMQIATCRDVKSGLSADVKTAAVHGQINKLTTVGAIEQTADLEAFTYDQDFLAMVLGDAISGSPAAGMKKITTKYQGVKKIGCLVGKRYSPGYSGVIFKWFLFGAQATGVDKDFPTEDMYKDSMKFQIDEYLEVSLEA